MQSNEIIGYRAYHASSGTYLHFAQGRNFLGREEPEPVGIADVYRRIAAFIEPIVPEMVEYYTFEILPVFRQLTPLETAAKELGGLLRNLTSRHGLDLGLTQDQIEAKIAKELQELGATSVTDAIARLR